MSHLGEHEKQPLLATPDQPRSSYTIEEDIQPNVESVPDVKIVPDRPDDETVHNIGLKTEWQYDNDLHPLPGDIIYFQRTRLPYNHVGIADGKGGVYHLSADPGMGSEFGSKSKAGFRHDNLSQAANGCKVRIDNSSDETMIPLSSNEIIRNCEQELGKGYGTYNLAMNNCEHKAHEMRYGEASSPNLVEVGEKTGLFCGLVASCGAMVGSIVDYCKHRQQPAQS